MATVSSTQARIERIEKVLVEAASLLVERARAEVERGVDSSGEPTPELRRLRDLEHELEAIRQNFTRTAVAASVGPQLSRYYDVPGQEDS